MTGISARAEKHDTGRAQPLDRRALFAATLVFIGYYSGAKFGFALTFEPHPISVLWPPNSILTAALLLMPIRLWWIALVAALPAHWAAQLESDVPPSMILCWFISNCSEALIGAGLARYLAGGPLRFANLRHVCIFFIAVVFTGPFLSSFLDAAFVRWNAWGNGTYWELWRIRFSSNLLAAATVVPLIVTWATGGIAALQEARRSRYLEASLLLLGLAVVSFAVLYEMDSGGDAALLYLLLPFLLWAAVRFGSCGASTAVAIVTFSAIWSAAHDHGPFSGGSSEQNALSIQVFLIVMSLPLLFLSTLIEERTRTEKNLREKEERINLAAESANLALWIIDPERDTAWMSERGRAIYEFGPEEPLSCGSFLQSVHPDDREMVKGAFDRVLGSAETFEIEHRIVKSGGQIAYVIVRGRTLFDRGGSVIELIGVTIDVTAQKRADLELQVQREEIAHLSRVAIMGEMAVSLAHELTQPLTGIVSNADAGRRLIAHPDINLPMLRDVLADISADGLRAGEVVHRIRRMVKKMNAVKEKVNLNEVVENVVHMVSPEASLLSCEVKTVLEPNLPLIEGDSVGLQQVLINLVINAFDAMDSKPTNVRKVTITTNGSEGASVEIRVRDFGVGISPEAERHLFDQFFTTKAAGLGMGLAIARSIVQSHGGTITGRNIEGGGAQFSLNLPAYS